jgi:hypothetical protein
MSEDKFGIVGYPAGFQEFNKSEIDQVLQILEVFDVENPAQFLIWVNTRCIAAMETLRNLENRVFSKDGTLPEGVIRKITLLKEGVKMLGGDPDIAIREDREKFKKLPHDNILELLAMCI